MRGRKRSVAKSRSSSDKRQRISPSHDDRASTPPLSGFHNVAENDGPMLRSSTRVLMDSSSPLSDAATSSSSQAGPTNAGRAGISTADNNAASTDCRIESLVLKRPNISYAGLIAQAIISSPGARLTIVGVYEWIEATYPYFKSPGAAKTWQNSIRTNLSNTQFVRLHSSHVKIPLYTIDPHSLASFETKLVVPQGTFNMMYSYIHKLIKEGPDSCPAPKPEAWPIQIGLTQVFNFASRSPSIKKEAKLQESKEDGDEIEEKEERSGKNKENDALSIPSGDDQQPYNTSHNSISSPDSFELPHISPRQIHQGMQFCLISGLLSPGPFMDTNENSKSLFEDARWYQDSLVVDDKLFKDIL